MKLLSELTREEFTEEMELAGITPVDGIPRVNQGGNNDRPGCGLDSFDGTAKGWGFRRAWCYWVGRPSDASGYGGWTEFHSLSEIKRHLDNLSDATPSTVTTKEIERAEKLRKMHREAKERLATAKMEVDALLSVGGASLRNARHEEGLARGRVAAFADVAIKFHIDILDLPDSEIL